MKRIKGYTDRAVIIYDHQKAATDIPEMGAKFAKVCKDSGIESVIIFPQAGPETEKKFIESILENDLIPIVGGEMTHPKYLSREGGYIRDDAPLEMYKIGAQAGAEHFVVPGNKPELIKRYSEYLSNFVKQPKFSMPGIGRQGGDIQSAFASTGGNPAYAIVGSGIYLAENIREATKKYCEEASKFE